ncbi:MAG TPA: hypothetical protein VMD59_18505, partial [Acidimicrobiales bacterium]|nr:hypothetical protein [Acidimicrobiales bacterium]
RVPPGADLRGETVRQLEAVFREGVFSVARPLEASRIDASVSLEHGHLVLVVGVDGTGIDSGFDQGHRLWDMTERARSLGGSFEARLADASGPVAVWSIPVG